MKESDKEAAQEGVGAEGGKGLIELALMFDLTEEEMDAIEEIGEAGTPQSKAVDGAGVDESGSLRPVVSANGVASTGRDTVDTPPADWHRVGAMQPSGARDEMTKQADFAKRIDAPPGSVWVEREATALAEVGHQGERGVTSRRLDPALVEGSAPTDWVLNTAGLRSRQARVTRLSTEFLGASPTDPLPETPVLESDEEMPWEGEVAVAPEPEPFTHEIEEVPPAPVDFPSWADTAPLHRGAGAARRVMPWLPGTTEEGSEGLLREADETDEPSVAGRSGLMRGQRGAGVYDLTDTEPFDLQHVALITEGTVRRDPFRRTDNLGEEIMVRLTFPTHPVAEVVQSSAVRSADKPADVRPAMNRATTPGFSPEALVSLFARSAEDEWADMDRAVVAPEESPVEVEAVAAVESESGPFRVDGEEGDAPLTIPAWPEAESEPEVDADSDPESVVSVLEAVEPFDVNSLNRVVRDHSASVGEGSGASALAASDARPLEWVRNPWASAALPVTPIAEGGVRSVDRPVAERWDRVVSVPGPVAAGRGGVESAVVVPSAAVGGVAKGSDSGLALRAEQVEPFELGHVLLMAQEQSDRAAMEPVPVQWDENPWNREQLPPGTTDREVWPARRRPLLRPVPRREAIGSPVGGLSPFEPSEPVVDLPAAVRTEEEAGSAPVEPPPCEPFVVSESPPVMSEPLVASVPSVVSMVPTVDPGQVALTALERELLAVMRESTRVAQESAHVVRESAVLAAESANAIRRVAQSSQAERATVLPMVSARREPQPVAGVRSERVVVPVEKMFSGISNALGDMVGSVVGRPPKRR